jgi:hypothetical protein
LVLLFRFLQNLFAGGDQGPQFANVSLQRFAHLNIQIVNRPDTAAGFKLLPQTLDCRTGRRLAQSIPQA